MADSGGEFDSAGGRAGGRAGLVGKEARGDRGDEGGRTSELHSRERWRSHWGDELRLIRKYCFRRRSEKTS